MDSVIESEENSSCDEAARINDNCTVQFKPSDTFVTMNERNDVNYIPPIFDDDLSGDDISDFDEDLNGPHCRRR
jgi:hypothetical protein